MGISGVPVGEVTFVQRFLEIKTQQVLHWLHVLIDMVDTLGEVGPGLRLAVVILSRSLSARMHNLILAVDLAIFQPVLGQIDRAATQWIQTHLNCDALRPPFASLLAMGVARGGCAIPAPRLEGPLVHLTQTLKHGRVLDAALSSVGTCNTAVILIEGNMANPYPTYCKPRSSSCTVDPVTPS